ncbi:MAG: DUF1947 domain-containing protein [Candidatus Bathyarchaeota archaeon]|nr:DUF1947 domain-containing protein [Candidatus Bathyarchaeota archaeon]
MPTKQRRYPLKTKDAKTILKQASEKLKINLALASEEKTNVEIVEADVGTIYLIAGKPALIKTGDKFMPTLMFTEFTSHAPKIVVDMGAVPYVCKGADVMAPGIVRIEGEFGVGDFVLVLDVKFGKALALGASLLDSATARQTKKGPVVKTQHYVGDKVWDYIKTLAE